MVLFILGLTFAAGSRPDSTSAHNQVKRSEGAATVTLHRVSISRSNTALSDDLWTNVAESNVSLRGGNMQEVGAHRVLELDENLLKSRLAGAAKEFRTTSDQSHTVISLPVPDGRLWRFQILESPVLSPDLATTFPQIKTYVGQGIDEPTATMRLSWTPRGLNAFVLSEQESFTVSPYSETSPKYYQSLFARDVPGSFECRTGSESPEARASYKVEAASSNLLPELIVTDGGLREYRMSFMVSQQFYQRFGGAFISPQNDVGVVAAITAYVNGVNLIYEHEIGVRFKFQSWIADNIGLCNQFTNCFSPDQPLGQMQAANQFVLDNKFPGAPNYDIGAALGYVPGLLPGGQSSFGSAGPVNGIGAACESSYKAQSATNLNGTAGDYLGTVILAHEWGHMFGARHTFTSLLGSCGNPGQLDLQGMVEPGSGSTIMSYAPVCLSDNLFTGNILSGPDSYFHIHSLLRISGHKNNYPACGQSINTGNSAPVITDGGTAATIPAFTPFTLTAVASDPNGDALTYNWEEWDPGTTLFRSYQPTSSPSRTFPSLIYVLNNGNFPPAFVNGFLSGEGLPATTRLLNFTVTARDNRSSGGGTTARDQLLQVNVVGTAGPFKVTQPNTSVTLSGGGQTTITWNVAGTSLAPINTSAVRILLSTDSGNTFPTVLAGSTANDGSEVVTLPSVQTTTARIKIEAVGNIYFDISDTNFAISNPTRIVQLSAPNYTAGEGNQFATITLTRAGDTSSSSSVSFATSDVAGTQNCNVINGIASSRCDYISALGTISFAVGETTKAITILLINDSYAEGNESLTISLSNPVGATLGSQTTATVTISDNETTNGANPFTNANFFVTQHYADFLNRTPDSGGLAFWTNEITSCGSNQACIDDKRVNVSAAYFLSIEFQQTGYLVERMYKAAYGDITGNSTFGSSHTLPVPIVRLNEFLPDTQAISKGVVVGQTGWELAIETNKVAFISEFVQRSRFTSAFATSLTPAKFVDGLFANAGVSPSLVDRNAAINEFGIALNTADVAARARALRRVAENATLSTNEFNRAFVLMQFFGYLRRNPNDPQDTDHTGYDFWLTKLNSFTVPGDDPLLRAQKADMVKAFITSTEYRQRFGP
jgi:hypothetical protein